MRPTKSAAQPSVLLLLLLLRGATQVDGLGIPWNGNWAHGCDFKANDMKSEHLPGEQCGGRCAATQGCTHFTWTTYNGGTCWMKSGSVTKNDAFATGDSSMVCGVVERKAAAQGSIIWNGNKWIDD